MRGPLVTYHGYLRVIATQKKKRIPHPSVSASNNVRTLPHKLELARTTAVVARPHVFVRPAATAVHVGIICTVLSDSTAQQCCNSYCCCCCYLQSVRRMIYLMIRSIRTTLLFAQSNARIRAVRVAGKCHNVISSYLCHFEDQVPILQSSPGALAVCLMVLRKEVVRNDVGNEGVRHTGHHAQVSGHHHEQRAAGHRSRGQR